jgi:hypothetical protein
MTCTAVSPKSSESEREGFRVAPTTPLDTSVDRAHRYTFAARVWDSSIVQKPFSITPCPRLFRYDSQLVHRGMTHIVKPLTFIYKFLILILG